MTQTALNLRVPEELKEEAIEILEAMGLSPSTAVRLFLAKIVNSQSIPFAISSKRCRHNERNEVKT